MRIAGWRSRDPTGVFLWQLVQMGSFDDEKVTERESQRLFYDRLKGLGYEATFHDLPASDHVNLSDEALQMMAEAILGSP
jgi:hypothetical protein